MRWLSRVVKAWPGRSKPRAAEAAAGAVAAHFIDALEPRLLMSVSIVFDYTYDTADFFGPQERRDMLEAAAAAFEARLQDTLLDIIPGPSGFGFDNEFDAIFTHPGDGGVQVVEDLNVPADTLIVYAGARDLGASNLALSGPGGFESGGTGEWLDRVAERGQGDTTNQDGDPADDFGPWGGSLSFNSTRNWHFDHASDPGAGLIDAFSIALHELAHVFGFGTADSFNDRVNSADDVFTGAASVAEFGGNVPMTSDGGHWAEGLMSEVDGEAQETALDPSIMQAQRKFLTDLDWAALTDIGWEVAAAAAPALSIDDVSVTEVEAGTVDLTFTVTLTGDISSQVEVDFATADDTAHHLGVTRVATGLSNPLYATAPPGDNGRLFILEQHTGRVRILDRVAGTILTTPFIDLSGLSTGNEQGLLGMAFHPEYDDNGFFYVYFTNTSGTAVLQRFQVSADPNVANAASGLTLLTISQPQSNHNGGWIGFGPDGFLYVATGDGGNGNDQGTGHTEPGGNAQDITNNLLGKILRIDVDGDDFPADGNRNYAIPPSNPFVGVAGDDEIWAYGLRNPWRASFDSATGDFYIGDVGQGAREEIDFQPGDSTGGENYGWRLREGTIATPSGGVGGAKPPGAIDPILDYTRGSGPDQGSTVIGGYVYRGPIQELAGQYFFADFINARIWSLRPDGSDPAAFNGTNFTDYTRWIDLLHPDTGSLSFITSFAETPDGNLFIIARGGHVFQITNGADYEPIGGTLVFNPGGATTQEITVRVIGDRLDELDETFFVNLSGAVNATIADGQGVGTIIDDEATPIADAGGAYNVDEGGSVALSAAGTTDADQSAGTLDYAWDFDNDGEFDDAAGINPLFTAAALDGPTVRIIRLRVTDDDGLVSTHQTTVTVDNVAPMVNAGADRAALVGEVINFAGGFTDPAPADTHTIAWDFGDGGGDSGTLTPSHAYGGGGVFTVTLTVTDDDGGVSFDTLEVTVTDPPPVITAVLVRGGGWGDSFIAAVDIADGVDDDAYTIPTGSAAQLDTIPWIGVNRIAVRFNEHVNVTQADLQLAGVNTADYTGQITGFAYNPATFTAAWAFASPLPADKMLVQVSDNVTDSGGNALDGEWMDTASTESGDGGAGGEFRFRFNLLPGDSTRNGLVAAEDSLDTIGRTISLAGGAGYNVFTDVTGNGLIASEDTLATINRTISLLPGGEPQPLSGLIGGSQRLPTAPETGPADAGDGDAGVGALAAMLGADDAASDDAAPRWTQLSWELDDPQFNIDPAGGE